MVEGAGEEEVNSEPTMLEQIQTFMIDMMDKQEEKITRKVQEMIEAQESRLRSEAKKVYGEPILKEIIGCNYSGPPGGDGTKTIDETSQQVKEVSNKRCTYQDFSMWKPPTYNGELESVKLYSWIVEMEKTFYACQCLESQKVNFAITMLTEDALDWWLELNENVNLKELEKMTWEEFLEKVEERFCSKDEICDLEREFMDLKKDRLSVKEYHAKFRKLLSFSRKLASDEETKVNYYKGGLPWNFKLCFGNPRDMNHAMRKAREIEMTLAERDQERLGSKCKSGNLKAKKKVPESKKPKYEGRIGYLFTRFQLGECGMSQLSKEGTFCKKVSYCEML